MTTALIVDDAPEMREFLAAILRDNGIQVIMASSGGDIAALMAQKRPDLVLLDLNLPDGDGLDFARRLNLASRSRVIFVTGRDGQEDRIAGLELGGDDYVVKPVDPRELMARVRNALRRSLPGDDDQVLAFSGWHLDLIRRELFQPNGQLLPLTAGEFNILAALAAASPQPLDRDCLLDVISNRDPRSVSEHTVDTLIGRLRRKMKAVPGGDQIITTVRGQGYMLDSKG